MIWRDRSIIAWKIACGIVQPSLFRRDAPPFDDLRVRRARTLNARPTGDRREDVPAPRPSRQPISSRHNRCLLRRHRCGRRMSARQTARSPRPAGSWIGMYPPARRPAAGHRLDRRRRQCVESAHGSPARQAQTIDPLSDRQRGNVDCYYVLCDKMPKMKKKAPPKRLVAYYRVSTTKQVGSGLGIGAQTATVESAPPSSGEDRCDLYGGRERQAIRATGVDERSTSRPGTARAQQTSAYAR